MASNFVDISSLSWKKRSVRTTMLHVMAALLPGTLLYALLIDFRILANLAIACVLALCCEFICLRLRNKPALISLSDGSIVLSSWLLLLCLPPSLPIWQIVVGVIVLVTLGKHVYGGLGQNPFNPAMVAYAFLLVSFPTTMTSWELNRNESTPPVSSTLADNNAYSMLNSDSGQPLNHWDGLTRATALDRLRELKRSSASTVSLTDTPQSQHLGPVENNAPIYDRYELAGAWITQSPWLWISLSWLLGGLYLLMVRIITWHIPATMLLAFSLFYTVANLSNSGLGLPVIPALLSGGIMLGAFFIATDPVSAPASRQGQIIYGFGIGLFTVVIREFSAYPEGVAFAVLLMNIGVPLIDYLSRENQGLLSSRKRLK